MPPTAGLRTQHVTGSAPLWLLDLAAAPRRPGRLLHTGPDAAYLDLDGTCVGVLAAGAAQVPCGARTPLPRLPALAAGDRALVGDGSVEVHGADGGVEVMVTGVVDTTVPVLPAQAVPGGAEALRRAAGDRLSAVTGELPDEPLEALAAAEPAAVRGLLGLGGGLTPLGDDVLAGWLATGVATRHPGLPAVRSEVALSARERTTTLSATLLACAARGESLPEFRALLGALAGADAPTVARSVDRLLDIGHTSGAGLVLGALVALQSPPVSPPLTPPVSPPPTSDDPGGAPG